MAEIKKSKPAIIIGMIIGKLLIIIGSVWTIFWGLMFAVSAGDKFTSKGFVVFYLILFLLGILSIIKGWQKTNLIKLYKNYVAGLSVDDNHTISNLAASSGQSVDFVRKKLNKMIENKYFVNAYIDEAKGCIVFPNQENSNQSTHTEHSVKTVKTNNINKTVTMSQTISGDSAEFDAAFEELESALAGLEGAVADFSGDFEINVTIEPEQKVVKCKGCGATNKVSTDSVTECEFCGSYLQA